MNSEALIKQLRRETALSQQSFANALGLSMSAIANYERNRKAPREPDIEVMFRLRNFAKQNNRLAVMNKLTKLIEARLGFPI